jgi:hypothetical protein
MKESTRDWLNAANDDLLTAVIYFEEAYNLHKTIVNILSA